MKRVAAILVSLAVMLSAAPACEISFDCRHAALAIDGKRFPIVCARDTGRGLGEGTLGHVIKASGPWRPGLVRPGTPMIFTTPRLCYDCFIHVATDLSWSNGCIGTTPAGFNALKNCAGSRFAIIPK